MELDRRDLLDVVEGAALLGSGGGGPIAAGVAMVDRIGELLPHGRVRVLPFEALEPDDLVAVVCDVGGSEGAVPRQDEATWRAFERLRTALERPLAAVAPIEIGPENSLAPLCVAARATLPAVDADGCRRAVPRLGMTTFGELPPTPAAVGGIGGASLLACDVGDCAGLEALLRPLVQAPAFANSAGLALWARRADVLAKRALPGGLTLARDVGRALRLARARSRDPIEALERLGSLELAVLAAGRLEGRDRGDGLDRDVIRIAGRGPGEQVTAFSVNEILIAWRADASRPLATAPDALCLLTADGQPFTLAEAHAHAGGEVILLGVGAAAALHADPIRSLFQAELAELGYLGPPVRIPGARSGRPLEPTPRRRAGRASRPR